MTEYAIHYGVVPTHPGFSPSVAGHDDPNTEREFEFIIGGRAFVSGSWACWGPADQDTDGDNTLHVVVYVDSDEDSIGTLAGSYGDLLEVFLGSGSRLLDWGVVSDQADWSENQAVFTSDGSTLYIPVGQA